MRSTLFTACLLAGATSLAGAGIGGVALAADSTPAAPAQVNIAVCLDAQVQAKAAAKVVTDLGLTVTTAQADTLRGQLGTGDGKNPDVADALVKVNAALRLATAADLACADRADPTTPLSPAATAPPLGSNVPDSPATTLPAPSDGQAGGSGQVGTVPSGGVDTGDGSTAL